MNDTDLIEQAQSELRKRIEQTNNICEQFRNSYSEYSSKFQQIFILLLLGMIVLALIWTMFNVDIIFDIFSTSDYERDSLLVFAALASVCLYVALYICKKIIHILRIVKIDTLIYNVHKIEKYLRSKYNNMNNIAVNVTKDIFGQSNKKLNFDYDTDSEIEKYSDIAEKYQNPNNNVFNTLLLMMYWLFGAFFACIFLFITTSSIIDKICEWTNYKGYVIHFLYIACSIILCMAFLDWFSKKSILRKNKRLFFKTVLGGIVGGLICVFVAFLYSMIGVDIFLKGVYILGIIGILIFATGKGGCVSGIIAFVVLCGIGSLILKGLLEYIAPLVIVIGAYIGYDVTKHNPIPSKPEPPNSKSSSAGTVIATIIVLCVLAAIAYYAAQNMFWAADAKWYFDNAKAKNFTISSAEELEKLAQIVNGNWIRKPENFAGKTITLSEDIDLLRYNNDWKPIGDSASSFSGTFDGGEHTIKGLSINRPNADRQGLFGRISKGKVQNLRLDGVNIRGRNHVGAIAGIVSMGSNLTNCYSSGKINGNKSVGGITGFAGDTSKVISSYSAGEVKGDTAVGGIAGGINKYSQVISNYSTSTVNGRFGVGGIAGGLFNNSIVFSSYSTGAVSGNESIGGVAGDVRNKSEVISCAALNREVKGTGTSVGRVAGFIDAKETLSDNVAFDEMKNSAGNTKWAKKGTSAKDGADITVVAINRDGTIGGRFTAANGWVVQNGSLPTIGKPKTTSPQTQKTAELEPINITDSSMYYIPVKDNNDFHKYIALDGKSITEAKYARAYVFREGRALVQEKDGTWGYIDTKGNDIAKGYTQGTSFREGIAWVNDDGVIKAINPNGNVVKTLPRDIISIWPFYEDLALFSSDGGQNYLDKDFNVAFNENFLDGNRFQENMASIMCDNGKYGYIDKNINYITDCEFDDARIFKNSKAIVRVGKGLGIINEQGKYILQPSDDIEAITHDGDMFRFKKKDGNWGWLNSNGQIAIQPNFIEAMNFGNRDIAPVRQDSLWGYIDKSGKYAISLQYRVAYPFINGRAFVKFADGYFATIDRNGRKDLQTNYQKFDNSYWEVINSGIAAEPKIMTVKPSSFNCASKLAGDYERIICKSFSLINLDNKMNSLYVNKKNDPDIAKSNKVFLAERNNCKDASCLERVYEARIDELESMSVVFP